MLHRSTLDRASRPGLCFQGWKTLPVGSKTAIIVLGLIALITILAPVIIPYSPDAIGLMETKTTPHIEGADEMISSDPVVTPSASHLFGTDSTGRDIFLRVVYGARVSLVVGLTAIGLALVMVAILGAVAVTSHRWIAETLVHVLDVVMFFPGIALAAVLVSAMSTRLPVLPAIIVSISIFYIPQFTCVVHANTISQFEEGHVAASKVMGAPTPWVLFRHVTRNCIAPIMVFATVLVAGVIVFEVSLSFIGVGVKSANTPTWGNMLSESKELLLSGHWWPAFSPGLPIPITISCLNVLSEGLTDAMASPRIKAKSDTQAGEGAMEAQEALNTWDSVVEAVVASTSVADGDDVDNGLSSLTGIAAPATGDVPLSERLGSLWAVRPVRRDCLVYEGTGEGPALGIKSLMVTFPEQHDEVNIVDGVSLSVRLDEAMDLVGELGCGKSISSMAAVGLLPPSARASGETLFKGRNIPEMTLAKYNTLCGHEMSTVYQDALSSLNPSILIRTQITQLGVRGGIRSTEELPKLVGLDPKRTLRSHPCELSGGQRQRVPITMALTRDPSPVLADEPATTLDVTVQKQVVDLLDKLCEKFGFAMVFVPHDLVLVAKLAHRITMMYAGQAVEQVPANELLANLAYEYTRGLLGAMLSIGSGSKRLYQVRGVVPSSSELVKGDRFTP